MELPIAADVEATMPRPCARSPEETEYLFATSLLIVFSIGANYT